MIQLPSEQIPFKEHQQSFPRVRAAYTEKEATILELVQTKQINLAELNVYIRAFKAEQLIEVWAKNQADKKYQLLIKYDVCQTSGETGPKRKRGDYQIPEGFYFIDRFNPNSNFHLSLGINYPNISDQILGKKGDLGGDIFIHGSCVTIGCLPITDDKIKELYLLCIEARNGGQEKIPVTIFPTKLTDRNLELLNIEYSDSELSGLWEDLKQSQDLFNSSRVYPSIEFLNSGRHRIASN